MRKTKGFKKTIRIVLRGGIHFLKTPIRMGPEDSGPPHAGTLTRSASDPACPLTLTAYPGETPVISGGRRIEGWREHIVNGKRAWVASIADVRRDAWKFRQLWVNGKRRYRPHLPRQGHFRMAGMPKKVARGDLACECGKDRFLYTPGDLSPHWRNLSDVEILFNNFWIDQRAHIRRIDDRSRLVILDRPTQTRLIDDSWRPPVTPDSCMGFYRVENVFEALEQPGEWYLDRIEGMLYYLPLPGEDIRTAEIVAPRLEQVLRIEGTAQQQTPIPKVPFPLWDNPFGDGRHSREHTPVQEIRFEGLTFSHTEWDLPQGHAAAGIQSACDVTGAVTLRRAHTIDFDRCSFVHLGGYGLECAAATRAIGVTGCEIRDTGAGGIKVWHGCSRTTVSDCSIHDGGHVHESGAGILIGRASGNRVLHNEVCDFGYSGISVGWDWTDGESGAYGNVIEHNHVHNIGRGELSDLGGVYTLGVAPGTRIRHNLIHDIRGRTQYAWGIYLDACSSFILVENNLVFRADDGVLMMNQNRGHVIRNNIFALGGKYQACRNFLTAFCTCTFERNIVYSTSRALWIGEWKENRADLNHNLYFVAHGKRASFGGCAGQPGMSFRQWQKRGLDVGSLVADPKFRDPARGDFRLGKNSPAIALGFVPFGLEFAEAGKSRAEMVRGKACSGRVASGVVTTDGTVGVREAGRRSE
ncbi:MAG: right-handed parallel beta-helix repeat-containing protein [Kiritimatiellae bacterium]|nr:right-handed parallel beta-helix repeat-containing protein [Kiritimatiellia bacterium]